MNKVVKQAIALGLSILLAIPLVHTTSSYLADTNDSSTDTSGTATTPDDVDIFVIGAHYTDAYPSGRTTANIPYYAYLGNLTGSSRNASVLTNRANWNKTSTQLSRDIPTKVGDYEIEGVEYIKPLYTYKQSTIPGVNRTLTFDDIKNSVSSDLQPKETVFSQKPAIVLNRYYGYESGSGEMVLTDFTDQSKDAFVYTASNYTIGNPTVTRTSTGYKVVSNIVSNWTVPKTFDNANGTPWSTADKLQKIIDDAREIIKNTDPAEYPYCSNSVKAALSKDASNFINKANFLRNNATTNFTYNGVTNIALLATRHVPSSSFDATSLRCLSHVCKGEHEQYQASYSSAGNYSAWRNYWQNYIVPGGIPGHDTEYTWARLWDGTYFNYVSADTPNVRVYQPYIIKLKVKNTSTNLALIPTDQGGCNAYVDNSFLYVKAVGMLKECPDPSVVDTIKLQITNDKSNESNTYTGVLNEQELPLNQKVDYVKKGSQLTDIASTLSGDIAYISSYIRIPITIPTEEPLTLKVKLYINSDQDPMETTFEDNPWEKEIVIQPQTDKPDLIAHRITYNYTNNEIGQKAKVNLHLLTKDEGFENFLSYVAEMRESPVVYKIWVDDTLIKQSSYSHPFLLKLKEFDITFYTRQFTETLISQKIKVELEINPLKDTPNFEETYENNKITKEFIITALPDTSPFPEYPNLPKFTNTEKCIYLDKDNPNSDSFSLFSLGTFQSVLAIPRSETYPSSGSQIAWNSIHSDVPTGLNTGKISSVEWSPVFPDRGVNGWVTTSDDDHTGGCDHCKYDPDTLDMYIECLENYQCQATFVGWDINSFQASNGTDKTTINNGTLNYLRLNQRDVSNKLVCELNCCYGDLSRNAVTYTSTELHPHHSHSHSYEWTDSDGDTHTSTHHFTVCEVEGNSCPEECHRVSCCGETYSNKNPKHYHKHTEYRLEYVSSVTLTYNIKLNKPSTKVVDYGSGDKITRSGYGIVTLMNASYATDYVTPPATGQYGTFLIKHFESSALVKTPATNKQKPYLISPLESASTKKPFDTKFQNVNNPASALNYKEIFIDVDYPDGQFPVLYQVLHKPDNFKPASYQYLTPAEQAIYTRYHGQLQDGLGICVTDHIDIKGNMWNDSWTHPNNQ